MNSPDVLNNAERKGSFCCLFLDRSADLSFVLGQESNQVDLWGKFSPSSHRPKVSAESGSVHKSPIFVSLAESVLLHLFARRRAIERTKADRPTNEPSKYGWREKKI